MPKLSDRTRTILAWALAAPWAIWVLIRLFGLERGAALVQVIAFTPYAVIVALIAAAAAAFLRRRAAAALAGLCALVLALLVLPRVIPDGDPPTAGPEVRVMSANLLRGGADLDRVIELARSENVDLLSIQELTPHAVEELRRRGMGRVLPYRVLADRESVYGSGIYARFPLRAHGFSPAEFRQPRAMVTVPAAPQIDVVCVHPIPPTASRTAKSWSEALRDLPAAAEDARLRLLVGDFNATLDHAALRDVLDRGYRDAGDAEGAGLTATWPSGRSFIPPVTIDHILAEDSIGIDDYEVHDLPGSDHRAVVATLSLPLSS